MKKKSKFEFNTLVYGLIVVLSLSIICNLYLFCSSKEVTYYVNDENIVFFGDSITEGYNINEFFPDTYVVNSGVGGNKTIQLLDRIETDVYKYNPSKVFILIGINDLNNGISKKDILNNIQKIINGIKINRKYTKIYIESIYPINRTMLDEIKFSFNKDISNSTIIDVNSGIRTLCEENEVTYINVYDSLLDTDGNLKKVYTKEGLHLTDLGYFKVTKVLETYIKE